MRILFRRNPRVSSARGRHRRTPRRGGYQLLMAVGVSVLASVVTWQVYAVAWETHSEQAGRALVKKFLENRSLSDPVQQAILPPGMSALTSCAQSTQSTDPVVGLLEIPKLGVTAPVEDGTGDAQLDVAVGHDPQSVWPGSPGTAVFAAHDVSYFVGLDKLSVGDTVLFVSPCTTYVYEVSSHAVVSQGSPVYNTPDPTITMVTCWPTDALWFTPDRYLVTASLVGQTSTVAGNAQYLTIAPPPSVPVPAALVAQGVTLTTYSLPMGTFALTGTPDAAWAQTTSPLLVQNSAVEAFIAGVRALTENQLPWWQAFAPAVSPPAPLVGAQNPQYSSPLDVVVSATGSEATAVSLTDSVVVKGGHAPGDYSMTVDETISNGTLVVSGWTMTPAG